MELLSLGSSAMSVLAAVDAMVSLVHQQPCWRINTSQVKISDWERKYSESEGTPQVGKGQRQGCKSCGVSPDQVLFGVAGVKLRHAIHELRGRSRN